AADLFGSVKHIVGASLASDLLNIQFTLELPDLAATSPPPPSSSHSAGGDSPKNTAIITAVFPRVDSAEFSRFSKVATTQLIVNGRSISAHDEVSRAIFGALRKLYRPYFVSAHHLFLVVDVCIEPDQVDCNLESRKDQVIFQNPEVIGMLTERLLAEARSACTLPVRDDQSVKTVLVSESQSSSSPPPLPSSLSSSSLSPLLKSLSGPGLEQTIIVPPSPLPTPSSACDSRVEAAETLPKDMTKDKLWGSTMEDGDSDDEDDSSCDNRADATDNQNSLDPVSGSREHRNSDNLDPAKQGALLVAYTCGDQEDIIRWSFCLSSYLAFRKREVRRVEQGRQLDSPSAARSLLTQAPVKAMLYRWMQRQDMLQGK
ncbi:hypothetical protein EV182_001023, partial [Spiromyces aspiralis]